MVDFALVPQRTALINVDIQNCFVHASPIAAPEGLEIEERIDRLAAVYRDAGILVIHTSIVLRADGSNSGVLGEFIPPVRQGILNQGSESAALHKGLSVEPATFSSTNPGLGPSTAPISN